MSTLCWTRKEARKQQDTEMKQQLQEQQQEERERQAQAEACDLEESRQQEQHQKGDAGSKEAEQGPKPVVSRRLLVLLHGEKANDDLIRDAINRVRKDGHKVAVRVTYEAGDVDRLVAEVLKLGTADTLVAAGGDGTVNEVVAAILRHTGGLQDTRQSSVSNVSSQSSIDLHEYEGHPQTAPDAQLTPQQKASTVTDMAGSQERIQRVTMAILPIGTSNDFAATTGIPQDPYEALSLATRPESAKPIDVGLVNNRIFMNTATVGASADVGKLTSSAIKKVLGPAAFLLTGARTMISWHPHNSILRFPNISPPSPPLVAADQTSIASDAPGSTTALPFPPDTLDQTLSKEMQAKAVAEAASASEVKVATAHRAEAERVAESGETESAPNATKGPTSAMQGATATEEAAGPIAGTAEEAGAAAAAAEGSAGPTADLVNKATEAVAEPRAKPANKAGAAAARTEPVAEPKAEVARELDTVTPPADDPSEWGLPGTPNRLFTAMRAEVAHVPPGGSTAAGSVISEFGIDTARAKRLTEDVTDGQKSARASGTNTPRSGLMRNSSGKAIRVGGGWASAPPLPPPPPPSVTPRSSTMRSSSMRSARPAEAREEAASEEKKGEEQQEGGPHESEVVGASPADQMEEVVEVLGAAPNAALSKWKEAPPPVVSLPTHSAGEAAVSTQATVAELQDVPLLHVTAANNRQIASMVVVSPNAVLDDGLLDVIYLTGTPGQQVKRVLKDFLKSGWAGTRIVPCLLRVPWLEIVTDEALEWSLDGEPAAHPSKSLRLSLLHKAILTHLPDDRMLMAGNEDADAAAVAAPVETKGQRRRRRVLRSLMRPGPTLAELLGSVVVFKKKKDWKKVILGTLCSAARASILVTLGGAAVHVWHSRRHKTCSDSSE